MHDCCHDVTLSVTSELPWRSIRLESKHITLIQSAALPPTYTNAFCGRTALSVIQLVMSLSWTSEPGCMAQLQSVGLNACLHQVMTHIVQAQCHRVAIPAAFAAPVTAFLIHHDPLQLFQRDAGVTCNCLQTGFLAAATSGHQILIAINAADVTQVIRRQLCIMLWAKACAVMRVDLLTGETAVSL